MVNLEDLSDEEFEKEYLRRKQERKRVEIEKTIADIIKANTENRIKDVIIKKWHNEPIEIAIYFGESD